MKVATIKHDVHGLDIDKEGKDSYRYLAAGAMISVVSSPEMAVYKIHRELTLDEIISNVKDVDLIIVEGYSCDGNYLTICVARKSTGEGFKGDINTCKALISDYSLDEVENMGYKGEMMDINDADTCIKWIKKQLNF